ncbi:MAG: ABC transporter permease [Gammaproteobacteria bacterium]
MLNAAASIARFTLIEGLRARLLLIAVGMVVLLLLAAEFSAGLAITDSQSYRTGVYAALARIAFVLVVVLFVATSVVREFDHRLLDLTLSRPVSRAAWYLGRLGGFALLAFALAVLAALPLAVTAAPAPAAAWGVSLAAELCLVTALALTAVVTLRQVPLAVTAAAAFYLLARVTDAMVLMSRGPTVDAEAWSAQWIARAVDALALVVPPLDRFTRAAWLNADALPELAPLVLQAAVYIVLLAAVGLFDLYRVDE